MTAVMLVLEPIFEADLPPEIYAYQQLLDHTQPKREPKIQPDGVTDDLGGKPVTGIAGASGCRQPTRLPTSMSRRKRPS